MNEKQVMAVLGPLPTAALGVTLTHEHLLFDQVRYAAQPSVPEEEKFVGATVEMHHRGAFRRNAGLIRDNGRVDDPDLAAAREAAEFRRVGGGTIV